MQNNPLSKHYFFVDLELSGHDIWSHCIIQIAYKITDKDLNVLAESSDYIQMEQGGRWCDSAAKYHGITREYLERNAKPTPDYFLDLYDLIKEFSPMDFVCHARPFKWWNDSEKHFVPANIDYAFLFGAFFKAEMRGQFYELFPFEPISTMDRSNSYVKKTFGLSGDGLAAWADHFGADNSRHHDAENDVNILIKIFSYRQSYQQPERVFINE
jgi:DNA polymerase III epsilon subunit-like protein